MLFVSAFGCAPKAGGAPAPHVAQAGASTDAPEDSSPFGENCRIKVRQDHELSLVSCDDKRVLAILPGSGWTPEASGARGELLLASRDLFNVSARVADEGETQYELSEHLEGIYRGVQGQLGKAGFVVGRPVFEQMKEGHLVLAYELTGSLDGQELRSANAFTAVRRTDRRYVDYHVSVSAPPGHPIWRESVPPLEAAKRVADMFFVTDENGHLPPQ
ncbi:MAG TPA: hypothetical protein VHB79_29500 [Polyangiaceae bacterium]|nr:hypothetical protein [Polyangiaceae bacterium]